MNNLNLLFRRRIGLQEDELVNFEKLDRVLEKTATAIPFENLCVISNTVADITQENLIQKILLRNEGGLCYELNTILYYFLKENGLDVNLARAIVFEHANQDYAAVGRTHVIILLNQHDQTFVVDTGFGGNLPLKPVPLSGEVVTSFNGEFRIRQEESAHGNYVLEMKLKHKDTDWKNGYAFHSQQLVIDIAEMNEVQKVITESTNSPFNKAPLMTRLTESGSQTLTSTSFTQWINGQIIKEDIAEKQFKELAKKHFEIEC
ncbi:MAG TPA: arylamine N-acetyltransferase [Pseudoneobacillus sp.]|nr:arylamine N-acetyltransferase [Pseudoneobacillus sp.]